MTCLVCNGYSLSCMDAFRAYGIHTIHWECWSECNLQCDFCYRSMQAPLDTSSALALIDAVAYGGASRLIFAGGDPSLRRDLPELCRRAVGRGLHYEIQTNGHKLTPALLEGIKSARRLYLSIDGPDADSHDSFRAKRGNFVAVSRLLSLSGEWGTPVTVHTVASQKNLTQLPQLLNLLAQFPHVDTWSVLQFSAIGAGYRTRKEHELTSEQWLSLLTRLVDEQRQRSIRIAALGGGEKRGLYAMVSADGYAYRAAETTRQARADEGRIGSLLTSHLTDIARVWQVNAPAHQDRYNR